VSSRETWSGAGFRLSRGSPGDRLRSPEAMLCPAASVKAGRA
jgi:hypothetical protein